jgi:hypothetical protein
MRRPYVLLLVGLVVVVFVVISALLARVFNVDGAERSAIITLLRAEAHGNANGVIAQIDGCGASAACRARAAANAGELMRPGAISILLLQTAGGGFTLGTTEGVARVAWRIGSGLPIVQCVRVRRSGNPISGIHIDLLLVSRRIPSSTDCPARF